MLGTKNVSDLSRFWNTWFTGGEEKQEKKIKLRLSENSILFDIKKGF